MIEFSLPKKQSPYQVLCLGAHCDDIEIGCGGTMLKLLAEYDLKVTWVVFSSTPERAREATTSAKRFLKGARQSRVAIHHFRDGFLPASWSEAKELFERLKTQAAPDLIFTHHRHDLHQDHRLINELTWNTFRNHLVLEYEIPKYDGDLGQPNLFVPLTEAVCRRKIKHTIDSFKSQRAKPWFTEDTLRALLRLRGVESASPTNYAEAFHCRKLLLG